jgi:SAM-dependent methyltransferase
VDVANSFYNPRGRLSGRSFAFPYRNASFDLVIATSVFTHLLPDTAVAYLAEVRRVLRAGGQLYATWFTLRDGRELLSQADPQFPFDRGGYRVASLEQPEAVVAFDRGLVMEWHARAGLQVETFAEGNWSRGLYEHPYQDVMVVRAAAAP